ncbi:hypothetical protein GOFOIKOB_1871 [Methylobacterium tardum]|uniref:Uncharacterized protein n=1 Tax=Methylobacterium tardum TaxID=374432 RepID=A0AA37THC7_9HYPH|nr:hypothetical protein [Methylobacterium tardum]URD39288.1 hypothetical protein M6G65_13285 [Methylobacterium tardum]GJE48837.1 hypothetical protein GOFOIKOB_1871 [Methylobacterium tardum]GLS73979.1 hypothetical protein GCM10007890_59940 [Methylobacterium tardum]
MKLPHYGRALRVAFDEADIDVQPEQVIQVLREMTAEIGAAGAEIFAAEAATHADAPPDAIQLARLAACSEIERALKCVLTEWAVPHSAETEILIELAEVAFHARLGSLMGSSGGAR